MELSPYKQLFDLKEKFINENFSNLKSSGLSKKIEEVQRIIGDFKTSKQMLEKMVEQYYTNKNNEMTIFTEDDMFVDFFGGKMRDISKDLLIGIGSARIGTAEEAAVYQKKIAEYDNAIDKYKKDLDLVIKAIEEMKLVLSDLQDKLGIIQSEEKLFGDLTFSSDNERAIAMANARVISRTFEPVLSRLNDIDNRIRNLEDIENGLKRKLNSIEDTLGDIKRQTKKD